MSTSFDFEAPEHFTAGAVGPPGHRVFYLQAADHGELATLRLEKQQVAALSEYLSGILADLPDAGPPAELGELVDPVVEEWVVGALAVAYEEAQDRILLVAEELRIEPGDADDDELPALVDPLDPLADDEVATARFRLTRPQVSGFIRRAAELMAGGRPPCPLCGRPMDPDGHACPRLN